MKMLHSPTTVVVSSKPHWLSEEIIYSLIIYMSRLRGACVNQTDRPIAIGVHINPVMG